MNTAKEKLLEAKEHFHGSDLEKIEKYFGIPKDRITAFGANVNPLGISPRMRRGLASHIDAVSAYPDPEYTELRGHIAAYAGLPARRDPCGERVYRINLFVYPDPSPGESIHRLSHLF